MRRVIATITVVAVVFGSGYVTGRSHGRDSRDLASRLEGHINHLVHQVGCQ